MDTRVFSLVAAERTDGDVRWGRWWMMNGRTFVGFLCSDGVEEGDEMSFEERPLCLCGEGVVEGNEPDDGESLFCVWARD